MLKKDLNKFIQNLSEMDKGKIIRSALADDVPFENIFVEFGLVENDVISLMKKSLPIKQFIKWRNRARGSDLKHLKRQKVKYE
jgi:uncharacterized protein (TIGR03643 family)